MAMVSLVDRLMNHGSKTELEAAEEICNLQVLLVQALKDRDIWRERALRSYDDGTVEITPTGFGTQG